MIISNCVYLMSWDVQYQVNESSSFSHAGILSSAVSQGGDIKPTKVLSKKVQNAYDNVKLAMNLRKCWIGITGVKKLRGN